MTAAYAWLVGRWQWPYAAAFAACILLALLPIVWSAAGFAAMLVYIQLPAYLLHQLEEHGDDRFRRDVNGLLGAEVLSRPATFAINLLCVWVAMLAAFGLAYYVNPALGLIAVYLTGVNAITHVGVAVATRSYNPGLATAVGLFVPLSLAGAIVVNRDHTVSAGAQLLALGVAVGGHLAIVAFVARRRRVAMAPSAP